MNQRTIWLAVLAIFVLLAILLVSIIAIPRWIYPPLSGADLRGVSSPQVRIQLQQAQDQLIDSARSAVLQGLAGLVLVVGAAATWWQVHISRVGQITDRFTRAIDQLGSTDLNVRVGGVYALERIARDSTADRSAIQYVMGAFVRTHASWPVGTPGGPEHPTRNLDDQLSQLRVRAPDIQAAVAALGRSWRSRNEPILYLSRVDLRRVALKNALMNGATFRESNLACAELINVWLEHADLMATDLRRASLEDSHLTAANLSQAYLQGACLRGTDLSQADLRGANLTDAILDNAVLTAARADTTTIWPTGIDADRRRELGIIEDQP